MKTRHLLLAMAALLVAGGIWFARSAWRAHRQRVTLDIPNATLAVVLLKIERQVWEKIRTEESLADVHVTLHVKDAPLSEVLNRLAEQTGALWNTVYAVYRDKPALKALDAALQRDGGLEDAGWTKIAPNPAALPAGGLDRASLVTFQRGPNGIMEKWSSQELVLESSLSRRLSDVDMDAISTTAVPTTAVAAQTARKVGGRWTTYFAFRQSTMGIGFKMSAGPGVDRESAASLPGNAQTGSDLRPISLPPPDPMPRPPHPNRMFETFTPEQRVKLARQGHGPGG